ncbi:glycosyltransferase [Adhaeribacter soli]|nr:glycosyltransferase [Adhaeribacter soli]
MQKTKILIASVLKPVNDTRMFEKLGQSLAKLPETEIHIAGFAANAVSTSNNIWFHPIFNFRRLSFKRIAAQRNYYKLLLQVKPEVIIASTYELLPVTILYRIFFRTVILYDVRENYYANIRFQPTFPRPLRWFLANGVRLLERLGSPFISHYFLAEKAYEAELPFIGKNYTVLENKYNQAAGENVLTKIPVQLQPDNLHFLYSGTISPVYGIWEAISFIERLHSLENKVKLTIIGYCPKETTYQELKDRISDKPYITLIGGNTLVPHPEIVAQIRKAKIGLLPYRLNRSTQNCIPTKLFEYLANGLVVIIPENPLWEEIVNRNRAGLQVNFEKESAEKMLTRIYSDTFYPDGKIPQDVFWANEEQKLLSIFTQKPITT